MKHVFILMLLAFTSQLSAQSTMEKLAAMEVDEDPLIEKNEKGIPTSLRGNGYIFLKKKQTKVEGKIRIIFSYDDPKTAARYGVTEEGSMREKIYSMKAVEYAEIEGRKFETMYVGLSIMTKMVIMEQIDNKLGAMKLFREYSLVKFSSASTGGMNSGPRYNLVTSHYIFKPGFKKDRPKDLAGLNFIPGFNKAMIKTVKDCPALVEKIKAKDEDYYYKLLMNHQELYLRLVNEYNECKK